MDVLLGGLRAAAEPSRLRLLALCAHAISREPPDLMIELPEE